MPTSAQIAERAGYSVRSVFERFPDLMSLRIAATDHAFAQGTANAQLRDLDGDRADADPLPGRDAGRAPARRGCRCGGRSTPTRAIRTSSRSRVRLARELILRRLELMYQPELSTLAEPMRRYTLIALEALTDFESWGRMRENYGLTIERGQRGVDADHRPAPSATPAA